MDKSIFIKGGLREGFRQGPPKEKICYRYTKIGNDRLIVHEKEAKIVCWIIRPLPCDDKFRRDFGRFTVKASPLSDRKREEERKAIDRRLSNEKYVGKACPRKHSL